MRHRTSLGRTFLCRLRFPGLKRTRGLKCDHRFSPEMWGSGVRCVSHRGEVEIAYCEWSFCSVDHFELIRRSRTFSECGVRSSRVTLSEMNAQSFLRPPECQARPHMQNIVGWIRANGILLRCIGGRLFRDEPQLYHSDRYSTHRGNRPWTRQILLLRPPGMPNGSPCQW